MEEHDMKKIGMLLVASMVLLVLGGGVAQADNIGVSGDIAPAPGGTRNDLQTAALLSRTANGIGLVLALGDTQYECGELSAFNQIYQGSWGQYKPITKAALGNHEYLACSNQATDIGRTESREEELTEATAERYKPLSADSAGGVDFYTYFGGSACPPPGYCSFDYQGWHFVIINTTFGAMTQAQRDAQLGWFKRDLAASSAKCQIVYGHHPYKASASPYTGNPDLSAYWPTMVTEDVDAYLAGHNHSYERTAPFRTQGNIDFDYGPGDGDDGHAGVREFVSGLGGRSIIGFSGTPFSASAYRYAGNYGIFKIVPNYPEPNKILSAFKTIDGQTLDRVPWSCH
jgi:hypothetical protein